MKKKDLNQKNSLIYIHVNLNSQIKKKGKEEKNKNKLSFLSVNSLIINNDDGDDSYRNNHGNNH